MTQRMATASPSTPVRTPDTTERSPCSIPQVREAVKAWLSPLAGERRVLLLERLLWVVATLTVTIVVWYLQDRNHPPLVWDEAVRMQDAALFAHAFHHGDLAEAWKVMNQGGHYPFLAPLIHSLVLVATGNIIVAAWLPSLIAYALSGVLAGRLASALGGGRTGAWIAAILCWATPINARVAGGAFTENMGACLLLLLLLGLLRLERTGDWQTALSVGTVAVCAWSLKYDYGVLATATLLITCGFSFMRKPNRRTVSVWLVLVSCVIILVGLSLATNFVMGRDFLWKHLIVPYSTNFRVGRSNWLYYPRALVIGHDVGLSPFVGVGFLAGLVIALKASSQRYRVTGIVFLVLVWYLLYSLHPGQERYLAVLLPALTALGGIAVSSAFGQLRALSARDRERSVLRWCGALIIVGGGLFGGWQIARQLTGPDGVAQRFDFLAPDMPAAEAYAFAQGAIRTTDHSIVVIGETNELNAGTLRVPLYEDSGFRARLVGTVYDIDPIIDYQRNALLKSLKQAQAGRIIGFDVRPGSRLDTQDFRANHRAQPAYLRLAEDLEQNHALKRIGAISLDDGRLRVIVWDVVSLSEPITVSFDLVNDVKVFQPHVEPITLSRSSPISLSGWAIDGYVSDTAGSATIWVDDTWSYSVQYGETRRDIAKYLGKLAYLDCGWRITIPSFSLPLGKHTLRITIVSKDGHSSYRPPQKVDIEIQP